MAVYRPTPKCPFCDEIIAKGVYKDQSNIPLMHRLIGDTFIRWDYIEHTCKGQEENDKKMKKEMDTLIKKMKKDGKKLPPFFKQ